MGFLFKIFFISLGVYYLFKQLTGKKNTPENTGNTPFHTDPNQASRKTDDTKEGEYVDFEEVD